MLRSFFALTFFAFVVTAFAAEPPTKQEVFRLVILRSDGTELKAGDMTETSDEPAAEGGRLTFKFNGQPVSIDSRFQEKGKSFMHRVDSPLLAEGKIGIGFEFPGEQHLPTTNTNGQRAEFSMKKGKTVLAWSGNSTLIVPIPRKKLDVVIAEYGAKDTWVDVSEIVRKQIVGDLLYFRAGNQLFGDPVGGVVKSFALTYSLGDEEHVETFDENRMISIQNDPKDRYFRLFPKNETSVELKYHLNP